MKQIFLIHGGDVSETYEAYIESLKNRQINFEKHGLRKEYWQEKLGDELGKDFQVIRPEMPSKRNAKYLEWKIWFEKFLPFINDDVVLIGWSLGGIFLAKYLAENDFPKKIRAVFLLAAPFDEKLLGHKLIDFSLSESLEKLQLQSQNIFLYHSKDDNVVSFENLEAYKHALPNATTRILEKGGHLSIQEFPELIKDIQNLWT